MANKNIPMIVEKRLKRHKIEVVLLWLIVAAGAIFIPAGIDLYLNVGKLAVTQYVSAITTRNFMVGQVEMLCSLGRALGIIFLLSGIAVTVLALNRLSLTKSAYRMASFIKKGEG